MVFFVLHVIYNCTYVSSQPFTRLVCSAFIEIQDLMTQCQRYKLIVATFYIALCIVHVKV